MPRKETLNPKAFDDEVAKCFSLSKRGGEPLTTQEERRQIALDWLRGDHESYVILAQERGLVPIALLVACMVDVEHPLLVREDGALLQRSLLGASVRLLHVELTGEVVHIHDGLVHTPCVQVADVHRQAITTEALRMDVHSQA